MWLRGQNIFLRFIVSIVRGAAQAIHQRQTQPFISDRLTEDRFQSFLVAFAEEMKKRVRILLDIFAKPDFLEGFRAHGCVQADVGRFTDRGGQLREAADSDAGGG